MEKKKHEIQTIPSWIIDSQIDRSLDPYLIFLFQLTTDHQPIGSPVDCYANFFGHKERLHRAGGHAAALKLGNTDPKPGQVSSRYVSRRFWQIVGHQPMGIHFDWLIAMQIFAIKARTWTASDGPPVAI